MTERIARPLTQDLTKTWLEAKGFPVLYGGAYWRFRVHLIDRITRAGKDLTGALAVWKWTSGAIAILRKSSVTSVGAPTTQIVFDDQSSEDTSAGTGTGWLSVYCYAVAAEVTEFATILGSLVEEDFARVEYELAVRFGGAVIQLPVLAGKQDIYKPKNVFPLV